MKFFRILIYDFFFIKLSFIHRLKIEINEYMIHILTISMKNLNLDTWCQIRETSPWVFIQSHFCIHSIQSPMLEQNFNKNVETIPLHDKYTNTILFGVWGGRCSTSFYFHNSFKSKGVKVSYLSRKPTISK